MDRLIERYRRLLDTTPTKFTRYLNDKISWDARLIAILGARGVGKSTLMLQRIKLHDNPAKSLYVSADDLYFSANKLYDLAEKFYTYGGQTLYIDEIHKYKGWSQEIKNIYDGIPSLKVIYTGSSILELEKGGADLSRRKLQYYLQGLSFREYLEFKNDIKVAPATLDDIINGRVAMPTDERPLPLFHDYLKEGYYPYLNEAEHYNRILSMVSTTLETDISQFADLTAASISKLKRLMYIISTSAPFKPNMTKISRDISYNRNSISNLFIYLEKSGLISQLRLDTKGISLLGKVDKVYLENTNIAYAFAESTPDTGNLRETFFFNATKEGHNVYSSSAGDFKIGDYVFEVGGKGKTTRQIKGLEKAFVVKDDIEYGTPTALPLWTFGFLY